ncbi:MAG: fimbria/pilus outer membrane usher protein [Zhongshania sp.]|uniref:fimbria/pilus outer membrane usher protein n=1 Tax=Zhongshania sp. TaxID=1971902 RepID=UPI002628BCEF|nr:fimbria/pilus outer membrane usher protein [Zhongshania sp.]MDF1693282.1 fimbria/pilus outer membrane usher protein [Zhongshania sp.]
MVSPLGTLCRQLTLLISCALASVWVSADLSPTPILTTDGGIILLDGPVMPSSQEPLYLEVVLNMVPTRYILQVMPLNGSFYVLPQHLAVIGIALSKPSEEQYLALDSIPDLNYRYDVSQQQLHLTVASHLLNMSRQSYHNDRSRTLQAQASLGALLNYDMYMTLDERGEYSLAASTAMRAFVANNVVENTSLLRAASSGDNESYTRLDTHWTWSSQDDLVTVTAGDFVSGGLSWTRATRLGGVQLRRNFALQPELVTQPLPAFFGEAALPSQVELYVEGLRQYSGEVLPGAYRIDSIPTISGLSEAQMVLTDALGRTTVQDFSFYSSPRLLQQGLSDFSLEAGSVRQLYGTDSFSYREHLVASASLRHGLSDTVTLESHAEGDEQLAAGGVGALFTLGSVGLFSGSLAQSAGHQADGRQQTLGYNWSRLGVTVDYSLQRSVGSYRDIASRDGRPPPQRTERLLLGLGSSNSGRVSLNYSRLDRLEEEPYRSIGASYSKRLFAGVTLFVNASRELDNNKSFSLYAGLSVSLGSRVNGGVSVNHSRAGDSQQAAYLRRGVSADGGAGWGLQMQRTGGMDYVQADALYRGDYAQIGGGVRSLPSGESAFGDLSGSFIWMADAPQSVFPAREVSDGFALVATNGIAEVPVLLENRPIGRTNKHGYYLLTGLGAYRGNQVSIDPLQLPSSIQFERQSVLAVPAERAGVRVDFGMRRVRAVLLTLHDSSGKAIPLGSRVLQDGNPLAIVGHDGQAYVEDLPTHNPVIVERLGAGNCIVDIVLPEQMDGISAIGPLICREQP